LNYTRICNALIIIPHFPENASRFLKFFIFLYLYILFAQDALSGTLKSPG